MKEIILILNSDSKTRLQLANDLAERTRSVHHSTDKPEEIESLSCISDVVILEEIFFDYKFKILHHYKKMANNTILIVTSQDMFSTDLIELEHELLTIEL